MKFLVAISFCFLSICSFSQNNAAVTIQSDNDAYLLNGQDRYYTNGLFFTYSNTINHNNKTYEQYFTLAQKIYTPLFLDLTTTQLMDRPFCGYLFAEYGQNFFIKNNSIKWNISLGTIGNASFGKDFQESLHKAVGLYEVSGWEYQLKQNICINAGITYMPVLFNTKDNFSIKALPLLTVNVGNVYTNAQAGILLATGFMNTIDKSSLISNTATDKTECYLYFQPQITAQAYNATVQGSLSANNKNGFTTQASTFMWEGIFGFAIAAKRVLLKLELHNVSRECTTQFLTDQYVSIQFTYRLK
ncbi:MAG: hypothetical protein C0459_04760 [Chitinophaga sp.]|jgi:lipid A 3-O-deacylase|nr:hypothetical protein [Chitinophaga sp.]